MKILRKVNGFSLNKGDMMANGLYNVINENNEVSFWFDADTAQDLLNMSKAEFVNDCKALIAHANPVE